MPNLFIFHHKNCVLLQQHQPVTLNILSFFDEGINDIDYSFIFPCICSRARTHTHTHTLMQTFCTFKDIPPRAGKVKCYDETIVSCYSVFCFECIFQYI